MSESIFSPSNLFAWCVASHEIGKRDSTRRMAMLRELGFKGYAWGNRMAMVKDLPLFDTEMRAMKDHGLALVGRYVPTAGTPDDMRQILEAIARHEQRPQIWATGAAVNEQHTQLQRVAHQADVFEPWAAAAGEFGFQVGLYNHAGWFGDPRNQVAIIQELQARGRHNVGIALCQHWSHAWLDDFEQVLDLIKPHLLSIALSGMTRDGISTGKQFLPVGAGDEDVRLLGCLERSGWTGPVGIINHTDLDAKERLADHLDGLHWVRQQLEGGSSSPPVFRTWSLTTSV